MQLNTEYGTVGISNDVIAAVASDTASGCFGVKGLADPGVMDGIVRVLKGETKKKGVRVKLLEDGSVSLQIRIVVMSGLNIIAACSSIISEVKYTVQNRTGVPVSSVEILVDAVKA